MSMPRASAAVDLRHPSRAAVRRTIRPAMSLWERLGRGEPVFSSGHRKIWVAFSGVLALCYLAVGVVGFVLGRGEASSIAWTVMSVAWGGLTACYWFRWPRRRFLPEDVDRRS